MSISASRIRSATTGLSLIELMIAMAIGVVLLLGLVQVMAASRTAYQLSTGVARTQENARFAIDFLQRDLRMAGHLGCVNDQSRVNPTAEGVNLLFLSDEDRRNVVAGVPVGHPAYAEVPVPLRFDMGLQGFEADGTGPGDTLALQTGVPAAGTANDWTPSLPDAISALNPVAGSDIVIVRYFSPVGAAVQSFTAVPESATITPVNVSKEVVTQNNSGLFGIGNCSQASVFAASAPDADGTITVEATNSPNKSGFSGEELVFASGGTPPPQTTLYRAESLVYYVAVRDDGDQPSLYRAHFVQSGGGIAAQPEELVEGVESLQLLYGLDYQDDMSKRPTGYIASSATADAIGGGVAVPDTQQAHEWRRVGAVQVGLLMRSSDRAAAAQAEAANAPSVLGVTMAAPDDGYYRSVYETTVALRNRLFGN